MTIEMESSVSSGLDNNDRDKDYVPDSDESPSCSDSNSVVYPSLNSSPLQVQETDDGTSFAAVSSLQYNKYAKDVKVAAALPSQFHERITDVEVASISEKIPCGSNLESLQEQETH